MKHSDAYYDWINSYVKDKEKEDKIKKKKKRMTYKQLEEDKIIVKETKYEVDDYGCYSSSTC